MQDELELEADVLVIGGSLAGTWAGAAAARAGAEVLVVDKASAARVASRPMPVPVTGGYDFPTDDRGDVVYRALRGPEYLRAMRRLIEDLGVTVLDHSPALELLRMPTAPSRAPGASTDASTGIGACGRRRGPGNRRLWIPRARGRRRV
jgi:glycine/D-amino acid oxidase-like deaminating enzyme